MDFTNENTGTWQDGVIVPDGDPMPSGTRVTWSTVDREPTREERLQAKREFLELARTAGISLGGQRSSREQLHERR